MRGEEGILDLPEVKGFLTVDLMFFFNFFLSIAEDVLDDINKKSIREIGITAVEDILLILKHIKVQYILIKELC